jgi:hypothetical protein
MFNKIIECLHKDVKFDFWKIKFLKYNENSSCKNNLNYEEESGKSSNMPDTSNPQVSHTIWLIYKAISQVVDVTFRKPSHDETPPTTK